MKEPAAAAVASPWRIAAQRFRRNPQAMLGLAIVAAITLFAVFVPLLSSYDPNASDFTLERTRVGAPPGPSAAHWLGTDPLFRDLLSRLAAGARVSLAVAVLATLVTTALGAIVGMASGMTAGGRFRAIDTALMRLVDVLLALPFLLFVTAVGVAVGRADVGTILLILGLTGWTGTARLVRAKTLQIRELDFVAAARALGARSSRIVRDHVLPNVAGTLIVVATSSVAHMILAEAVLSYLTVGVQPPRATWGRMLHEGEPYLGTRIALIAVPGFAILLSVLGFHRVGEGLRDALDPRGGAGAATSRLASQRRLPVDLLLAIAAMLLLPAAVPNGVGPPIGGDPVHDVPQRGGVLRVATLVNVGTLDPAIAYDDASRAINGLVFARLVTWDPEGNVVPDLARAVTASTDGASYTFELREGLRFHDGTELRAADVQRSLERLLHPKTPSPGATLYAGIKGFEAFHAGKAEHLAGVRVTGERSLTIDLEKPDATFLPTMTMAFAAPVCASAGLFADAHATALPCGAGPFRAEAWDPDKSLRLVRYEGYYQPDRPHLDGVEWFVNVPSTSQRFEFERGELDYTRDLSATEAALYRASDAWAGRYRWLANAATNAIFLNTEVAPFHDRAMRRAVALAVDPSALSKVRSDVVVADRVVPPSIPGPATRPPMRRHDLPAALAEMARAGYPFDPAAGKGGYPHEIEYLAVPDTWDQQTGEIWQQQLARVGIRIRLRLVTYQTFLAEASRRRTTAMGRASWSADFPDASNFFEPTLSSAAISDEGSQNAAFFANAELDALLVRAHAETDRDTRFEAYERAEAIVRDEAPWVPAYGTRTFEIWQPRLRGYAPHATLAPRFNDVWLDRSTSLSAALGLDRRHARGPSPLGGR